MANPIGCAVCEQVGDAEFLVTDRTPDFQLLGTPTIGMCVQCFIEKGLQLATALQAAFAEVMDEEPTPGALESVEATEGKVEVVDPVPPKPKSKAKPEPEPEVVAEASEAEASHVGG